MAATPAGTLSAPVVAAVLAAVARLPGAVAAPVGMAGIYVGTRRGGFIDGLNAEVMAPAALPAVESPAVVSGSLRRFGAGSLIVDARDARADGLRVGMPVAVWGPGGRKRDVTVAAVAATSLAGDLAYVSAGAVSVAPSRIDIRLGPGTGPAARASAAAAGAGAALRAAVAGQPAEVVTRAELTAELAGATRPQVLSYVAAESLVAIVAGTVVAALAGGAMLAVDWLGLHGLIGSFPVSLPWRGTGAVVAACAVIGVLAATGTAARALRARPRAADA